MANPTLSPDATNATRAEIELAYREARAVSISLWADAQVKQRLYEEAQRAANDASMRAGSLQQRLMAAIDDEVEATLKGSA